MFDEEGYAIIPIYCSRVIPLVYGSSFVISDSNSTNLQKGVSFKCDYKSLSLLKQNVNKKFVIPQTTG